MDISKAFDNVNHSILIQKLNYAGIRGNILNWFVSYLHNKQQRVKINSNFSNYISLTKGVPQGSILGPLLFLIFINDFCKLKLFGSIVSYADDSVLLYSCSDLNTLKIQVEQDLVTISNWFSSNHLDLNLNKTKYMYFSLKTPNFNFEPKYHSPNCTVLLNCPCYSLQSVNTIKYLGLHIDCNLKWKTHVNEISKKLRFVLYKFYYLKNKISKDFLTTLYYTWFYSIFNYGILVWGSDYKSNLHPIISLQNKCFKILNNFNTNNPPLYKSLRLLPVRYNAFFRIILQLFKNKSLCKLKENISNRRPNIIFELPPIRKEVYRKHFLYIAPKLYNSLPLELQSINNYNHFKKVLFSFLIEIDDIDLYFHTYRSE